MYSEPRREPEKVRLPISKTLIWWAIAGLLALGLGLFAVFYFAEDASNPYETAAEGYIPDELVPGYLEEHVPSD